MKSISTTILIALVAFSAWCWTRSRVEGDEGPSGAKEQSEQVEPILELTAPPCSQGPYYEKEGRELAQLILERAGSSDGIDLRQELCEELGLAILGAGPSQVIHALEVGLPDSAAWTAASANGAELRADWQRVRAASVEELSSACTQHVAAAQWNKLFALLSLAQSRDWVGEFLPDHSLPADEQDVKRHLLHLLHLHLQSVDGGTESRLEQIELAAAVLATLGHDLSRQLAAAEPPIDVEAFEAAAQKEYRRLVFLEATRTETGNDEPR